MEDTDLPDAGSNDDPPPISQTCDTGLGDAAMDLARAMELCDGTLLSAVLRTSGPGQATVVQGNYGSYSPHAGQAMATIASGDVSPLSDKDDDGAHEKVSPHPAPRPAPNDGCGQADPSSVMDMVTLELRLRAPDNATGFSFKFNFMSAEFPEFHCTEFDDTFLAVLTSSASPSENISFDENDNVISINTGFFDVCSPAHASSCMGDQDLAGTGYEGRGGTGWLTTQAPIEGGKNSH